MNNFTDTIKLFLTSGNGGAGIVSFRREKFIPKGGPDGGDGGNGGDIILIAKANRTNLIHLRSQRMVKSQNGQKGGHAKLTGASGKPTILEVPAGTIIKTINLIPIHDFTSVETSFTILKGGKGGKGNYHFRSSTNKAPRTAGKGTPGQHIEVFLELKLIADIGIVGLPNAGKSTLLSVLTAANPKTAAYPFTTLIPNLGAFHLDHTQDIVLADIPGLIEGAHLGKGLGTDFLRHIERTRALLFLLDGSSTSPSPEEAFTILRHEMHTYSPAMLDKPFIIVISKCDTFAYSHNTQASISTRFKQVHPTHSHELLFISSLAKEGLADLKKYLSRLLQPQPH